MIDLVKYKDQLHASEESIDRLLENLEEIKENDRTFFSLIQGIDEKFLYNSKICLVIMEALQLSNSEDIYSTYDLKDIEAVYDLMLKHNPNHLKLWMDAIYFHFNVLNHKDKVRDMINELNSKVNSISRQLESIRQDLG